MTVASKKAAFLRRYNPNKSIDKALSRGISASVQHNSLYGDKISQSEKCRLREEWKRLLLELSIKYKSPQSIVTYENDIKQLKDKMNHQFSDFFRSTPHPKYNYDPGFRISHSQKSISVSLKHLWCMGEIVMAPQCPVDAVILGMVGKKHPETKWGFVNSMDIHKEKMSWLEDAVNGYNSIVVSKHRIIGSVFEGGRELKIAEWELAHFNP